MIRKIITHPAIERGELGDVAHHAVRRLGVGDPHGGHLLLDNISFLLCLKKKKKKKKSNAVLVHANQRRPLVQLTHLAGYECTC